MLVVNLGPVVRQLKVWINIAVRDVTNDSSCSKYFIQNCLKRKQLPKTLIWLRHHCGDLLLISAVKICFAHDELTAWHIVASFKICRQTFSKPYLLLDHALICFEENLTHCFAWRRIVSTSEANINFKCENSATFVRNLVFEVYLTGKKLHNVFNVNW